MLIVGGADLDKRSGNPAFRERMLVRYLAWIRSCATATGSSTRASCSTSRGAA